MEEADRIGVELLPLGLVAFDVRQPTDAVTLKAPVKGRAGELTDRSLESVQAVVQRQQRVLTKRHDDGLLFDGQNRRPGNGVTRATIGNGLPLLPLGDRLLVDGGPEPSCSLDYAVTLDGPPLSLWRSGVEPVP